MERAGGSVGSGVVRERVVCPDTSSRAGRGCGGRR
jgi:hypothetical protein